MATVAEDAPISGVRAPKPDHVPADRVFEFDMYAPEGIEEGFHESWMRVVDADLPDLVWTPFTGGHWMATKGEIVEEVYGDPTRFSSKVIFLPKEAGEHYQLVPSSMDPPEHTPYRKALDNGLNPAQIRKVADKVRKISVELIEKMAPNGHCDFAAEYSAAFPVQVFMALCDLPIEDVPLLNKYARMMTRPAGDTPEEMALDLKAGNEGFAAYSMSIAEERIGGKGDDLITIIVNSEINGEVIKMDKAVQLIALLLLGGLDTVVNLLSFMMIYLADHPEIVDELRDDPVKLARGAEEMFRRFPVVVEARMVAKDMVYRDTELRYGDMILIPTPMHSFDKERNPDPMTVKLDRRSLSHNTFGGGPHRCAGMHLARLEMIITLEEWLKRVPRFSRDPNSKPIHHAGTIAAVENVQLVWDVAN